MKTNKDICFVVHQEDIHIHKFTNDFQTVHIGANSLNFYTILFPKHPQSSLTRRFVHFLIKQMAAVLHQMKKNVLTRLQSQTSFYFETKMVLSLKLSQNQIW